MVSVNLMDEKSRMAKFFDENKHITGAYATGPAVLFAVLVSCLLYHGAGLDVYAWAKVVVWQQAVLLPLCLVLRKVWAATDYGSIYGRFLWGAVFSVVLCSIVAALVSPVAFTLILLFSVVEYTVQMVYLVIAMGISGIDLWLSEG